MANEHGLQIPDIFYRYGDTRLGHVRRLAREHQNDNFFSTDIDLRCVHLLASSELFLHVLHYFLGFAILGSIWTSKSHTS